MDKTPLYSGATPAEVAADLAPLVAFHDEGMPTDALEALVAKHLLPHLMRYDLPRFQSMFNTFLSSEAKLGATIALDYNQGVTNWQVSPGGAMLEVLCANALCRLFKLGPDADATFMYSGTYANAQAVYLALHRHAERSGFDFAQKGLAGFANPQRLRILASRDAHFSLKHAVRMAGLGEESLLLVPVGRDRRMDTEALRDIVAAPENGHDIFCMVATTGSTSTGAIDSVVEVAKLCAQENAWLHVDGAYGYAYKLVPEWAERFAGDDQADSITWDPHKQMGAPIPSSVLFVRQRADLARMALHSDYFNRAEDIEPNPGLKSPPSTRSMAALPLITILRGQGITRVIADLRAPLVAVRQLADYLSEQPDISLCHQPDTAILCFRMTPTDVASSDLHALQRWLYDRIMAAGERSISMTKIDEETVLRLVSVSPHTTFEDFRETIDELRGLVNQYHEEAGLFSSNCTAC